MISKWFFRGLYRIWLLVITVLLLTAAFTWAQEKSATLPLVFRLMPSDTSPETVYSSLGIDSSQTANSPKHCARSPIAVPLLWKLSYRC